MALLIQLKIKQNSNGIIKVDNIIKKNRDKCVEEDNSSQNFVSQKLHCCYLENSNRLSHGAL